MSAENSVQATQLTRKFGDFIAVDQINFDIPKVKFLVYSVRTELEKPLRSVCYVAF